MYLPQIFGHQNKAPGAVTPIVEIKGVGSPFVSEGDTITSMIYIYNPVVGMSFEIYSANAGGSEGDYNTGWNTMLQAECTARGLQYDVVNSQRGKVTVLNTYDGQPMTLTRQIKEDGTTEGTEQADIIFANPIGCVTRGVVSRWISDTSGTPPGATTIRFTGSGGSNEGDVRSFTIVTENMTPGTQIRLYRVNTAARAPDWVENFQSVMAAACAAAGCTWSYGYWDEDGFITFGSGYSDANPITWQSTIKADLLTEGTEQCDWIITGVPAGIVVYNSAVSIFIQDTSQTPTYLNWQVDIVNPQPNPGDVVTYRMFVEDGIVDGSVQIGTSGDAVDNDFTTTLDAAITAALPSYPGLSYDTGTKTLTATTSWVGTFQFQRTLKSTTTATKHAIRLSNPSTNARLKVADAVCFIGGITKTSFPTFASGINLSGPEFGGVIPGTVNVNYFYPTTAMMDWYVAKGYKWFRLPFLWGRLQRTLFGDFDAGEIARIDAVVNYITNTKGCYLLLDPHNYASYSNGTVSGVLGIGSGKIDPMAFYDFWEKLANRYGDNPKVQFGLVNEPYAQSAFEWRAYAQGAVNAIRARTNKTNLITVPGTHWTGAHAWYEFNEASFRNFKDPVKNFIFEVHQYLDSDSSGTAGTCSMNAGTRLDAFTGWCRTYGYQAMLGEFGVSDPTVSGQSQCATEIPGIFNAMSQNKDVWRGYTLWGSGEQWPSNYMFRLNPVGNNFVSGADSGSMVVARDYIENVT